MKLKKEYILLTLVALALVLYLTMRSANHDAEDLPQPAKIESAKINRLVVTDKENPPVELVKKDEKWFIEPQNYQADIAQVINMVKAAAELSLTALVSESSNYERYELTPKQKINVQAFGDGKLLRTFDIGKAAPTFQHTFVMLEGDPKIYHARGQLRNTFSQSVEALRDKTIFDLDKESINALTIQKAGKSMTATKVTPPKTETQATPAATASPEASKAPSASPTATPAATPAEPPSPKWQGADGQDLDKAEVDRILGAIAHLKCDGYLDDPAKAKLTEPLCTLTFKTDKGEFSLSLFAKQGEKADKVPALASSTPFGFVLNGYRFKEIEKTIDKLLGIEEVKAATPSPTP